MSAAELDLKTSKIHYAQANQIQQQSPIVAFYLKNYIIMKAVETLKADRTQEKDVTEFTKEVQTWFQDLEGLKRSLGNQLQNQNQNMKIYSDFTHNLLTKCSYQYQQGVCSPQLAEEFSTASILCDAFAIFNSPDPNMDNAKNYAKTSHQHVLNALQGPTQQKASVHNNGASKASNNQALPGDLCTFVQGYSPQNKVHEQQNPYASNAGSQQNQGNAFSGFQVAESVFVPKAVLDVKKSVANPNTNAPPPQSGFQNQQSQRGTFGVGNMATSVYQQGLPQDLKSQVGQAGQVGNPTNSVYQQGVPSAQQNQKETFGVGQMATSVFQQGLPQGLKSHVGQAGQLGNPTNSVYQQGAPSTQQNPKETFGVGNMATSVYQQGLPPTLQSQGGQHGNPNASVHQQGFPQGSQHIQHSQLPQSTQGQRENFGVGAMATSSYQQGLPQNLRSHVGQFENNTGNPYQQGPPQNLQSHVGQYGNYLNNPHQQGFSSQYPQGGHFGNPGYPMYQQGPPQNFQQHPEQPGPSDELIPFPDITGQGSAQDHSQIPGFTKFTNAEGQSSSNEGNQDEVIGLPDLKPFTSHIPQISQKNPYANSQLENVNVGNPYAQPGPDGAFFAKQSNVQPTNIGAGGFIPNVSIAKSGTIPQPNAGANIQASTRPIVPEPEKPATKIATGVAQNNAKDTRSAQAIKGSKYSGPALPKEKFDTIKDLCMMAISELDFKNAREAKNNIKSALKMLNDFDPAI